MAAHSTLDGIESLLRLTAMAVGEASVGIVLDGDDPARLVAATSDFRDFLDGRIVRIPDAQSSDGVKRFRIFGRRSASALRMINSRNATAGHLVVLHDDSPEPDRMNIDALREAAGLASIILDADERLSGGAPRSAPSERNEDPAKALSRDVALRVVEDSRHRAVAAGHCALLLIDLDRFRAVNDALGMAAGDTLLTITAHRLFSVLRDGESLLRLEGDRFVIVARRRRDALHSLAHRALEAIALPVDLCGQSVSVDACIGIVSGAPLEVPTAIVLLQAETALKRAKLDGRSRFVLHEPAFDAAILEKSQLELELSNAPGNGQMHMVYQPYVDLATGKASGAEALMRWRHPGRGTIMPNTFIPIAESTGLILPLGTWALRRACVDAMSWPTSLVLSVNISALQFHQHSFTAQVDAALADSGFAPERLELEITETVLMRDNPETTAQIEALIDRGVRIALDDFGTGYSALAYLARLPHHRIKLDRAFVRDLNNPATAELIRAIISTATANGVSVTAEGVERPEQLTQVKAAGFTHAQGFAVGTPSDHPTNAESAPVEALV